MFTQRQTGFESRLRPPHMDCDPDSNPDSGPGASLNAALDDMGGGGGGGGGGVVP